MCYVEISGMTAVFYLGGQLTVSLFSIFFVQFGFKFAQKIPTQLYSSLTVSLALVHQKQPFP